MNQLQVFEPVLSAFADEAKPLKQRVKLGEALAACVAKTGALLPQHARRVVSTLLRGAVATALIASTSVLPLQQLTRPCSASSKHASESLAAQPTPCLSSYGGKQGLCHAYECHQHGTHAQVKRGAGTGRRG